MSDLLNSASLVLIPSGYKEDTVYSVVPSDGSGDLSFTRASNGTRVNSAGLVEVCPWNVLKYSEDFTNAYWTGNGASVSANAIVSPNGTTTADKIIENSANSVHHILYPNDTPIGTNTLSVYAKEGERSWIWLYIFDNVTGSLFTWFNVNTGTIGTVDSGLTANIESVGNGWFRCSITRTQGNVGNGGFGITNANSVLSYTGNGTSGAYFWGAQLNQGALKPYFPTTDRLNVPRLTYQNGGGGCPSLLLEKQSTNLATYSEQFDNAAWVNLGGTITANYGISPDGTQNADRFQGSSAARQGNYQTIVVSNGVTYTLSMYVKSLSGTQKIRIGADYGCSLPQGAETFTFGETWTRITTTFTSGGVAFWNVYFDNTESGMACTGTTLPIDCLIWGFQCEASSYPTSYIPTTSASATRVADACFKTGISSLIGQTEGVLFADVTLTTRQSYSYILMNDSGSSANYIGIYYRANAFEMEVVTSSGLQANIVSNNSATGRFKIAIAYKSNDFVLYINGTQIGTDTSGSVPTCNKLDLFYNGEQPFQINQAILFKTRLTNAELASLTTI